MSKEIKNLEKENFATLIEMLEYALDQGLNGDIKNNSLAVQCMKRVAEALIKDKTNYEL